MNEHQHRIWLRMLDLLESLLTKQRRRDCQLTFSDGAIC